MNLLLRVVSGAILLGILAGVLWAGTPYVAAVVAVAALVAAWELSGLLRRMGVQPAAWLAYPLTLWLALRFAFPAAYRAADWPLVAAVTVGLVAAGLMRRSLRAWAASVVCALYSGFTLGFYVALYRWHEVDTTHLGVRLAVLTLAAVFAGDTVAYAAGTLVGRHGFFRRISPRKTVEGAVTGAAASILVGALAGPALISMSAAAGAGLGALVALFAQGGDLAESALKREAGVKDSSHLIPGHGGLLDRIDSLVLVGPVVYCYLRLIAFT
ncbi:MAG: phosphatidate cytidylyltransferase [Candidatus Dormibacteraeota bacterium]|nr:phosphatidate cytidylyltransferase [Candidatus Dormibacteraeota bacterium]MBV9524777.1 phosphatidate cytidylyltransferase [Candidatus Dormibacteraeota bacterium]